MIIVSQDKKAIINFNKVTVINYEYSIYYRNPYIICARYYDSDYIRIGFYKTEERAKEVLQEITLAYEHSQSLRCGKTLTYQNIFEKDFVYEMPEE